MIIKDYRSGDEHQILDLFKKVFNQESSLELWKWRFIDNPYGGRKIKLMWDGEELVGQYAVSPVNLVVNNCNLKSSLSLSTMTHPRHEGKGIFKSLANSLYDDLAEKHDNVAVWGFPNTNSHGGFVGSLKWNDIAVLHTLGIQASNLPQTDKNFDIHVARINQFTAQHEQYILDKTASFPIKVSKNTAYLNWRYLAKPLVRYYNYFGDISGSTFLIVAKLYPTKTEGLYDLNLLECHVDDYSLLKNIIASIIGDIGEKIDKITLWRNLFDPFHLKLERIGFKPSMPLTYLGAKVFNPSSESLLSFRHWYIAMGDSDVY